MRGSAAEPKPFDFVPFVSVPQCQGPVGHGRWHAERFTGCLDCQLRVLSTVHIGSGLFDLMNGQVVRGFMKCGEQFIVPGASLKGVFRSIAETISASCVSKTQARVQGLPVGMKQCEDSKQLCVCCRLFGSLGYLGRMRYTDAEPVQQTVTIARIPSLYGPRPNAQIYRDQQGRYRGRKFYYHGKLSQGREPLEAVAEGSLFAFRTDFENLTEAELHLLLTSMGIIGGLKPKIGGGKPVCLGSVEVTVEHTTLYEPAARFLDYDVARRSLTEEERQRIQSASALVRKDALNKLQSILAYPSPRACPTRTY
jgi:CRISPR/Cas system CSM-associated protein Csm3 (group 7 of RAMP superfamily)